MKKIICLFLFTFFCYGQTYPLDINLYPNKEVIVKEKPKEDIERINGFDGFFLDIEMKNVYLNNSNFKTPYDSLVGKKFFIKSFENLHSPKNDQYLLIIFNDKIGTLYYKHILNSESYKLFDFEFLDKILVQQLDVCNDIKKDIDKFTKKVTYRTPVLERVYFSKSGKSVYMSIKIPGSTLSLNKKGLILLLKDGSKISKPNEEISVDYDNGYKYSAFVLLSSFEIEKIIKNPITDVKLYVYEAEIFNPEKYSQYLECLIKK